MPSVIDSKPCFLHVIWRMAPWLVLCVSLLCFSVYRYREGLRFETDLRQVRQLEKIAVNLYFSAFDLKGALIDSLIDSAHRDELKLSIEETTARLDGQLAVAESQLGGRYDLPALPPLRRTFSSLQSVCRSIVQHKWEGPPEFIEQQRHLAMNLLSQWFVEVDGLNAMSQLKVIQLDRELTDIQRGNLIMFIAMIVATGLMVIDMSRMWKKTLDSQAKREALLSELAHLDPLTSLLNRRGWDNQSQRVYSRCMQAGQPMAVVMLDLDHFKRFNDQHGHTQGDQLLKQFASELLSRCRPGDVVARMGGEEFAVALPGCDAQAAYKQIERLRHDLTAPTRFSSGIAQVDGTLTIDQALQRADLALYDAKRQGRARSVVYSAQDSMSAQMV